MPKPNAGLPGSNACVRVVPPLNCSGPRWGSEVTVITPGGDRLDAITRLSAPERTGCIIERSEGVSIAPAVLLAMIELCSANVLLADKLPNHKAN